MNRRNLLGAAVSVVSLLAGCSGTVGDLPSSTDAAPSSMTATAADQCSSTATAVPEIEPRYGEPDRDGDVITDDGPERTDADVTVGHDREDDAYSHGVSIWNDADKTRDLTLRISDRTEGVVLHEASHKVSSDGAVDVGLVGAAEYLVDIGLTDSGTGASFTVAEGQFDCNASTTHVRITRSDRILVATLSTMVKCMF